MNFLSSKGLRVILTGMAAAVSLSACSAPETNAMIDTRPATQIVRVATPGETGAHCFLQSGQRSYATAAPGNVEIMPGREPMDVTCFKGKHMVGNQKIMPSMSPGEAKMAADDKIPCHTCQYPAIITVMLMINPNSLERTVTQIQ